MFAHAGIQKRSDTGEGYSEDKVIKSLEKSIKEWAYAIHDKDPGLAKRVRPTAISTARRHRGVVPAIEASAYQGLLK